jgi:hypothetical protein
VSRRLAAATVLRPDVASVVVGINDTLRGDFDTERTGASVSRTVAALRATGADVLTMRLPDPGQMFGLPGALGRPLAGPWRDWRCASGWGVIRAGLLPGLTTRSGTTSSGNV